MEREIEYNTELTKIHHTNYVRNSRAIVMLWAIFTIIFTVLNIVVFLQPQWVGDTGDSAVAGYFGVAEFCEESTVGDSFNCEGNFLQWDSMRNSYFRGTAVCVGLSCLFFAVSIACFVLFCLLNTATVLRICGWFQSISGILMLISVLLFPAAWDDDQVRAICGFQAKSYDIGVCGIRWGYVLAIVLVFDAFIMAILAFVLAAKQANLLPTVYKEEKARRIEHVPDTRGSEPDSDIYRNGSSYYMSHFDLEPHHPPKGRGRSNNSFIMD